MGTKSPLGLILSLELGRRHSTNNKGSDNGVRLRVRVSLMRKEPKTADFLIRPIPIRIELNESLIVAWNRGVANDHMVKQSTQYRYGQRRTSPLRQ